MGTKTEFLTMHRSCLRQNLTTIALALGLAGATACHRHDTSSPQHSPSTTDDASAHQHEEITFQITVWTNGFEVFAEFAPILAGAPTTFITHVTDLNSFEPRTEGPIRFQLQQGDLTAEQVHPAPERPGIYLPAITFPQPGDWQVTLFIPTDTGEATIPFPELHAYADPHDAAHADFPEPPTGIAFLKEQQWKIGLTTEAIERRQLAKRIRLVGETRDKPGSRTVIVAPVSGHLLPPDETEYPLPGDELQAGQLLARLRPSLSPSGAQVINLEAELTQAQATAVQAKLTFERIKELAEQNAKSIRELEEARLNWVVAQSRLEAAEQLRQTYRSTSSPTAPRNESGSPWIELRTPLAGTLDTVRAGPGEWVRADDEIFVVGDTGTLWIEARVPEASLHSLQTFQGTLCELPHQRGTYLDLEAHGGSLVHLGQEVDPDTRTIPALYQFDNTTTQLRIGQQITLLVQTDQAHTAIAIPETTIINEHRSSVAFVHVAGETFEKRQLKLGIRDGPWVEVLSGLHEGERVAANAAYALRLASLSTGLQSHGHAH